MPAHEVAASTPVTCPSAPADQAAAAAAAAHIQDAGIDPAAGGAALDCAPHVDYAGNKPAMVYAAAGTGLDCAHASAPLDWAAGTSTNVHSHSQTPTHRYSPGTELT